MPNTIKVLSLILYSKSLWPCKTKLQIDCIPKHKLHKKFQIYFGNTWTFVCVSLYAIKCRCYNCSFWLIHKSNTPSFSQILMITEVDPIQCGKVLYKASITHRKELLGQWQILVTNGGTWVKQSSHLTPQILRRHTLRSYIADSVCFVEVMVPMGYLGVSQGQD